MRRLLALAAIALIAGCKTPDHTPENVPVLPDASELIESQTTKDTTVVGAADRIDTAVKGHEVEPTVKVETEAIRQAVHAAPASDITILLDQWRDAYDRLIKITEDNWKVIEELKDEGRRQQVLWFNIAGFALFGAYGLSVWLGGGLLAAKKHAPLLALSGLCFGMARVVGSPWFETGTWVLLGAGLLYGIWVLLDDRKSAKDRQALAQRQATLRKLIPVLDNAKRHADEANAAYLDEFIFGPLKEMMSDEDKAFVKQLRRESLPNA